MHDSLSCSELLSAFLDGELDESTTTTLFYTLAHNQDIQMEMRELIAVRNGFRGGLLTPPDALQQALHRRLGFSEPAVASTTAPSVAGLARSTPFLMVIAALTASLLTFLFVSPASEVQRMAIAVPHFDMVLPVSTAHPNSAQQLRPSVEHATMQQSRQAVYHEQTTDALPPVSSPEQIVSDGISRIEQAEQHQLAAAVVRPEQRHLTSVEETLPPVNELSPGAASGPDGERRFGLSLRGFSGRSFPDIDIRPLAEPPVNNIAAGLLYRLDDHHALGIEAGQESLLQRYDGVNAGGNRIMVEQNYLALWGGVAYRYTLLPGHALQPFGGIVLGGTATGPMARLTLGAGYRLGAVSLTAGIEGMLHTFRYQDRWFFTQKINATYGISFHF